MVPLTVDDARSRALRHAPCGLFTFADDGRVVHANAYLHGLLKVDEGALLGRPVDRLLTPASRVFHSSHFFPLLKLHGHADEVHLTFRASDGTDIPVTVSAVREADGDRPLNHCVATTMWRRHEFEKALVTARDAADAATRAKDEFLATLSHELRTPLSAVLGWTRLAQSGQLDAEKQRHALETIERNARLQARLIDDLLDVSRIASGKLRLSPRPIELTAVVDAAVDTARPAAQAKGIHLRCALEGSGGVVYADPDRVQQIVWNLLSNAIKFTPKGGAVDVTLARADSRIRVEVKDTGQGVAQDALPYLFDRFWQAQSEQHEQRQGLGLGLAICRSLTELHGGTIRAESEGLGKGTSFIVEFPLAVAGVATVFTPPPRADADEVSLRGTSVLVVDDDDDSRGMLRMLLETAGATVRIAGSCDEALNALREAVPDVLLTDIGMPGRDGFALIADIRRRVVAGAGDVPAIALTGLARPQDRVRLLQAGFQAHLAKPVEPAEVVALVTALKRRP